MVIISWVSCTRFVDGNGELSLQQPASCFLSVSFSLSFFVLLFLFPCLPLTPTQSLSFSFSFSLRLSVHPSSYPNIPLFSAQVPRSALQTVSLLPAQTLSRPHHLHHSFFPERRTLLLCKGTKPSSLRSFLFLKKTMPTLERKTKYYRLSYPIAKT